MISSRTIFIIIKLLICLPCLNWTCAWAAGPGVLAPLDSKLAALAGKRDAIVVAAPDGRIVAAINADHALVPASILKLLSTLAALEKLGSDYRFKTDFYIDPHSNLKIKGHGDPLLISEELKLIAERLVPRINGVNDLILDDSYFEQPVHIPGRGSSSQPYDAPNGALCVNFNTVAFNRLDGNWVSDEPQTPLLPSIIPKIAASGLSQGRITLAADSKEALQYAGELFRYFFNQAGIKVKGAIRRGRTDTRTDQLVMSYSSRYQLRDVVADLLEYSNNFMANQMLLVMGAEVAGPPATMNKGLKVLNDFYRGELGIETGRIAEASGISRQNRITARAMLEILQHYEPYHDLLRKKGRQFYKTGHLKGIRTRAGFLMSTDGGLYRFVVIINTPGKATDKIMAAIERHVK